MATVLPLTSVTMYLQPDGTYATASTGLDGETAVQVPVTDFVGMDDLDANGSETASDFQALAQDVYHLLWQSLGSDLDDPTRGVGAEDSLSGTTTQFLRNVGSIDAQLKSDTRIARSETTVNGTSVSVQILPVGSVLPISYSYSPLTGVQLVKQ